MTYEVPDTVIIDDSNEFVQYLYNDRKDLRTRHEVLDMTRVIATKPFDFKEKEFALVLYEAGNREIFGRRIRIFIVLQHISLMQYLENLYNQSYS